MKIFKSLFLFFIILFPVLCFSYDNFVAPPEDTTSFVQWFFSSFPASGAGWMVITGFVLTLIVGVLKLTSLKSWFDKLGSWKFAFIMILGAVAELVINLPSPFTWSGFLNIVATGALGTGSISIAIHHILDNFIKKK